MILLTRWISVALLSAMIVTCPASAFEDWSPLIQRLIDDNFDEKNIQALFADPVVKFDPDAMSNKLRDLINSRFKKPSTTPAEKYKRVYERFLTPTVIAGARSYTRHNRTMLEDAEKNFCVPKEIIVAILLVETDLEVFLGAKPAFNTLASMALSNTLDRIRPYLPLDMITSENEEFAIKKCNQKSEWAYQELKALIRYASTRHIDPRGIPGSIYGAIGICQFMPSKISSFGVDADNDGTIDVFSKGDAFFSIANYLYNHGWTCRMNHNNRHKIIMSYNHSSIYANTVLQIAEMIKQEN